ncbi:vitamin B12 dependent-methionine synthase activation domain-containing protein [Cellulosilyticum ruminicola]|uniref:vitamin B12 dependent-methionine synthase activation domain-containing protein n=1 Tax=Cellulosilyticum ruminicola TaxID=425254 RepID=UPI0006D0C529|nr:vitamin B12 dependent-methionine synthase activation domain-containing protein [Cellulosilyticum ruminicola]
MTHIMLKDALRYIGMPMEQANKEIIRKVEEAYELIEHIAKPKAISHKLNISLNGDEVIFENTALKVESSDLARLLRNAKSCYIMAVTLGQEVDRQIGIKQRLDMLDAMILDSCASVFIDKVCDEHEQELMKSLKEGEFFTMRFSPGYGNVPLKAQRPFLNVLQTEKKIGLTLTRTNMLVPTKSITAIVGISNQKEKRQKSCGTCNLVKTCSYRKRGDSCGL